MASTGGAVPSPATAAAASQPAALQSTGRTGRRYEGGKSVSPSAHAQVEAAGVCHNAHRAGTGALGQQPPQQQQSQSQQHAAEGEAYSTDSMQQQDRSSVAQDASGGGETASDEAQMQSQSSQYSCDEEWAFATRAAAQFAAASLRRQRTAGAVPSQSDAAVGDVSSGDPQWARLMHRVLSNEDPENASPSATAATPSSSSSSSRAANVLHEAQGVVSVLRRVLESATFKHFTVHQLDRQFSRAFLIQAIGQYVSAHSSRTELTEMLRAMKGHMDLLVGRVLNLDQESQQMFRLNVFPNAKQSRMFALQYALHKKLAAVAATVSDELGPPVVSSHMQPLFYVSSGSPLYPGAQRYAWELMLPNDSFRLVPTKRVTRPTGFMPLAAAAAAATYDDDELSIPTYTMDLDALRAQLSADVAAGYMPVALVATLGTDVASAAAVTAGGGGGGGGAARYQADDLEEMGHIADEFGLWLHVEGTAVLLGAAPYAPPTDASSQAPAAGTAAARDAASLARAVDYSRSAFRLCDSVSSEVMGWFDLAGSTCIGYFKQDPSSTAAVAPQPPGMQVSRDVIGNLFTLWFSLVSHEPSFVEQRVQHLLSVATHWRRRLSNRRSLPFPVLVGPTGPDADLFPQYLFFQVAPVPAPMLPEGVDPDSEAAAAVLAAAASVLPPLEEFGLDLNGLNAYIYARLSSHVPEPFLAREDLPSVAPPAAEPQQSVSTAIGAADSSALLDEQGAAAAAAGGVASPASSSSLSSSAPSAAQLAEQGPIVETDADDDASVPLSAWRRAGLLACMDSSVTLASFGSGGGARVGFLLHVLTSSSSSSSLTSAAEARHVEWFLRAAGEEMEWMRAAVALRSAFRQAIDAHPELHFVPLDQVEFVEATEKPRSAAAGAAAFLSPDPLDSDRSGSSHVFSPSLRPFCYGIGAFSYAPPFIGLTSAQSDELNIALAESLSRRNGLYAPARSSKDGRAIIVVQASPIVLRPNAVALLLHELHHALRRQRLPKAVLADVLGPAVQAGIRAADERRLKERTPLLFRPIELARKVPGVGWALGWLRPEQPHEQTGGRSFQIAQQTAPKGGGTAAAAGTAATTATAAAAASTKAQRPQQ